jgi:uracil-DNA glycosylase
VADEAALEELRLLTRALRGHAEWQMQTGAHGFEASAPSAQAPSARPQQSAAVPVANRPTPQAQSASPLQSAGSPLREAAGAVPLAAPIDPEVSARRLAVLATEVSGCTRCRLHEKRTQTVFARGTSASGVCFVGEGPGADEDAQGFPFVGKAGQLLDRMIAAMGFLRDDVYVCNIVKCRPPDNRKPEADEMAACTPYLVEQLELVAPKVIVALGATAVQGLLGTTEGITRLRGKWKLYQGRIAVMPTFHPAYLLRTPAAKREVWEDLQAVLRHIGRALPERGAPER